MFQLLARAHLPVGVAALAELLGMAFRDGVAYSLEGSLSQGLDSVSGAASVECRLSASSFAARSLIQKIPFVVRLQTADAPASGKVTLCFSLARDADLLCLHQETVSLWNLHSDLQASHWATVKESCSGIGALGLGTAQAGCMGVANQ